MMRTLACVAAALLLQSCASPAPVPEPGFDVVDHGRHRVFQALAAADWGQYTAVQLETASVEFRDNWVRDQDRFNNNLIREHDLQRITDGLSELLQEVLTGELVNAGYTLAGEAGAGVLLFKPRVVELDVYAPDKVRNSIGFTMADSKGRMRVELDVYDSVSGALLASSSHYLEDHEKGYFERANTVSNRQAFRLMLERWSRWLLETLDGVGQ